MILLLCHLNKPFQQRNTSLTFIGITHWIPNIALYLEYTTIFYWFFLWARSFIFIFIRNCKILEFLEGILLCTSHVLELLFLCNKKCYLSQEIIKCYKWITSFIALINFFPLTGNYTGSDFFKIVQNDCSWQVIWSCLMHGLPIFSNVTGVVSFVCGIVNIWYWGKFYKYRLQVSSTHLF